jgi:hypothetical protein
VARPNDGLAPQSFQQGDPKMIKPTVGRIVLYHPSDIDLEPRSVVQNENEPLAAIVTCVWSDTCVNLTVFGADGVPHGRTSVPLIQDDAPVPPNGYCCEWTPYQKGQAKATEELEVLADEIRQMNASNVMSWNLGAHMETPQCGAHVPLGSTREHAFEHPKLDREARNTALGYAVSLLSSSPQFESAKSNENILDIGSKVLSDAQGIYDWLVGDDKNTDLGTDRA